MQKILSAMEKVKLLFQTNAIVGLKRITFVCLTSAGIPHHSFVLDIDADPAAISIHHASGHIVLASLHLERKYVSVSLYKSDGKFEHKYRIDNGNRISVDPCITVTKNARIIAVLTTGEVNEKSSKENKAMIIVI